MIRDPIVMLDNLVLSLSDSLDLIHSSVVDHQQRVAYIALRLGRAMGYGPAALADLMYAAVLHDIGALSVEEKVSMMKIDFERHSNHAELGSDLLGGCTHFAKASEYVRYHHYSWGEEEDWRDSTEEIRLSSNAIHLADYVDRFIDRDAPILHQVKGVRSEISRLEGTWFSPDLVKCFQDLAVQESFWLDFSSSRIYRVLLDMIAWPRVELQLGELEQVGMIFSQIVDFRSSFTATHSAGVGTVARELAKRMYFSEKSCRLMHVAGFLHDLGKVAVPNSILDKPGKLDPGEFDVIRAHTYYTYQILSTIGGFEDIAAWAAFHHERLDGKGYPFRLSGSELSLGSRIMCVADVFTAITENRPYRRGTERNESMPILHNLVKSGSLDGNIVRILDENFEEMNGIRARVQETHMMNYKELIAGRPSHSLKTCNR
ncbi:MAG: HD domain-containing protein [Deltaproteobacteria bacterium]|nr:HD domain-containing protein [Deltaproteobacteria bacterium]